METLVAVVPDNLNEGAAIGDDALTALDNPKLRNLFLDDLYELDAFLSQRLMEMQGEGNILSSSLFQSAPTSLQVDEKTVETMTTGIRDVIGQLSSVQIQHLLLISNSPRYVDRVRDNLRQILQLADKMVFYEKELVVKREAALEEQRQLEPKLDVVIGKSRQLQKQVEKEISVKYKKRPVNIMGEINTI